MTQDSPLEDATVRHIIQHARHGIFARIAMALAWAAMFVGFAVYSHGPILALWHVGFSISLMALGWSVFSLYLHRRCAATLADDLAHARALGLSPRRFWQAHAALFPSRLL